MNDRGLTLTGRFSNAGANNWISTNGSYWYDMSAVGFTLSTVANGDMITKAFYNAKGTDIKLTRCYPFNHSYLLHATGCSDYQQHSG